jgi:hypothetical protein
MTTKRIGLVLLSVLSLAWPALAQTSLDADPLWLWSGGSARCALSTGNGAPSGGTTCDVYIDYATGDAYTKASGTWKKFTTYGTVTSVDVSVPAALLTVSGGPVTTSGAIAIALASQTQNKVFASPNGSTGTPTFRALVNTDIAGAGAAVTKADDTNVTLTLGGSASTGAVNAFSVTAGWTGQLSVPRGGTGKASWTAHTGLFGNGTSAATELAGCTNGLWHWSASSSDPTCNTAPTVTSLSATSFVGSSTYASQTTGWRVTSSDGAGDFRYVGSDELRVKLFTAEKEALLAGSQRITKSYSTISQTFTCPALGSTSTLWVFDSPSFGDAAVFVSGDSVVIHSLTRTTFGPFTVSDCVGVVTAYADGTGGNAGQQSWTFTRNTSTNGGAMSASTTVAVNELVQDFGTTGNGYVEDTALDGAANVNAPYTQVVTWATAPVAANLATRCRMGNLKGITSVAEYGLFCGDGGLLRYIRVSDQNFDLHGVTAKWWDSATNVVIIAPNSGSPYISIGNPVPSACCTTAGLFLGWDHAASKAKASFYSDATHFWMFDGSKVTWQGTNASLDGSGNLTATGGTIGGWTLASTTLTGTNVVLDSSGLIRSGATSYASGTGWVFDYNGGTPRGRIGSTSGNRIDWGRFKPDGQVLELHRRFDQCARGGEHGRAVRYRHWERVRVQRPNWRLHDGALRRAVGGGRRDLGGPVAEHKEHRHEHCDSDRGCRRALRFGRRRAVE